MAGEKSIKNWNEEQRPRERMLQKGASALTDVELMTILIASGTKSKSAMDLAREVLALADDNLLELGKLNVLELQKIKGIGEARAITICAALELGRRRQLSEGVERKVIFRSREAIGILRPLMQDLDHEIFYVIYMNSANRILKHEAIARGGMTATVADVRMILKNCILNNATHIIVAHNHPSGSTKPSTADIHLTTKIKEGAALMDIKLMDHLIVAGGECLSMADEGYM